MKTKMNGLREIENGKCYIHPREKVVGVCALCLNERLVVLASKQNGNHHSSSRSNLYRANDQNVINNIKPPSSFLKMFALSSFLNRLELIRPWNNSDYHDSYTSPEDSFISIKFEENGLASWEKNSTVSKVSLENCKKHNYSKKSKETKTVIEHGKPRASSLRWRKRIGHLFQLIRWKKSNKDSVCHFSTKVGGFKVRKKEKEKHGIK